MRTGYVPRPVVDTRPAPLPVAYGPNAPSLPEVPAFDQELAARSPQAPEIAVAQQQLAGLPSQYAPLFTSARDQAKASLAGFTGVGFSQDDPSTPQDESLRITYDPRAQMGERERGAIKSVEYAHAARGDLHSSWAQENVASAVARLDEERREVVQRYMSDISRVGSEMEAERSRLRVELGSLYGSSAAWAMENPDPAYVPPVDNRKPLMTFERFMQLHPGKRSKEKVKAWDKRFNFGRLLKEGRVS